MPRRDRILAHRFRVDIDNIAAVGFREVSGLKMGLEKLEYPEGGQNAFVHNRPTRVKWPPLVLRKSVEYGNKELYSYAARFFQLEELALSGISGLSLLKALLAPLWRRNITLWIGLFDQAGNPLVESIKNLYGSNPPPYRQIVFYGAWVSDYEISTFDAMKSEVATETIVIQHNGWVDVGLEMLL